MNGQIGKLAKMAREAVRNSTKILLLPLLRPLHYIQKSNETLRYYIQRWTTLHHTVENVSHHQAVCAFKEGVKNREMVLKFGRTGDMSLTRMMEIATRYADGEEEDRIRSVKNKPVTQDTGGGNSSRKQK